MKRIKKYCGCDNCHLLKRCHYSVCVGECNDCTNKCCLCVGDCSKCHLACANRTKDFYNPALDL